MVVVGMHVGPATSADRFRAVLVHELDIVTRMGIPVTTTTPAGERAEIDLIVDPFIGDSLVGASAGLTGELGHWANGHRAPCWAWTPGRARRDGQRRDSAAGASHRRADAGPAQGPGCSTPPESVISTWLLEDTSVPPLVYRRMGCEAGDLFGAASIITLSLVTCGEAG